MFPISSDGVFEDPSTFFEQDNFIEELLADCPILEGDENTEKIAKKRQRKAASFSSELQEINDGGGSDGKKTAHRFTERQRRQEMSALYASLRSLLPLEYVKGKRAISDHMHEAVNYINDMKKKMVEMQKRRDALRKRSTNVANTCADSNTNVGDSTNFVKISLLRDGMEILISSSINIKERFNLSKVFGYLVDKNLNIINCVSTTGASSYLNKIHLEIMNEASSIDLPELQEQLENLITIV